MKESNKVLLLIIGIIVVLGIMLGSLIFGSQYALDQYKKEHLQPVCNDTTNETIPVCMELNDPGNYSVVSTSYVIYAGY